MMILKTLRGSGGYREPHKAGSLAWWLWGFPSPVNFAGRIYCLRIVVESYSTPVGRMKDWRTLPRIRTARSILVMKVVSP
jgi:hypothetical protein